MKGSRPWAEPARTPRFGSKVLVAKAVPPPARCGLRTRFRGESEPAKIRTLQVRPGYVESLDLRVESLATQPLRHLRRSRLSREVLQARGGCKEDTWPCGAPGCGSVGLVCTFIVWQRSMNPKPTGLPPRLWLQNEPKCVSQF